MVKSRLPGLGQADGIAPPRLDDASEAGPIAPGLHLRRKGPLRNDRNRCVMVSERIMKDDR